MSLKRLTSWKEIDKTALQEVRHIFESTCSKDELSVSVRQFCQLLERHGKIKADPDGVLEKWFNQSVDPVKQDKGRPASTSYKETATQGSISAFLAQLMSLGIPVLKRNFGMTLVSGVVHWPLLSECLIDNNSGTELTARSFFDDDGSLKNFTCRSTLKDTLKVEPGKVLWTDPKGTKVAEDDYPNELKQAIQMYQSVERTGLPAHEDEGLGPAATDSIRPSTPTATDSGRCIVI